MSNGPTVEWLLAILNTYLMCNHSDCWISNKWQMSVNKTHYSDRSKKLVHVWYLYWISYESQMNLIASDYSDCWIPSK